ncbi:hypothetical protein KEM55_009375 [Ascosphaera atra]|nr:hypothetical protein KEM55_009375 [Ascosphaera atra]
MAAAAGSGGGSGSTGGRSSMDKKSYTAVVGLREADLKPAFRALQTAYIKLMQNPFYSPDNVDPIAKTSMSPSGSTKITNSGFVNEVQKIGEKWRPGPCIAQHEHALRLEWQHKVQIVGLMLGIEVVVIVKSTTIFIQ